MEERRVFVVFRCHGVMALGAAVYEVTWGSLRFVVFGDVVSGTGLRKMGVFG